jgi:hypothetical protein
MSARQILEELPVLSPDERRQIANRALELNWDKAEREAMEFSEAASAQLAQFIDEDERAHEAR